ncbi:hypothetical protein [Streptomyces sp. NPDC058695]|uniref:hypothetical protein n=1 Tax=Streptomyces sp. NPDC058695 TaxID=3346604 RepID=UPI003669BE5E
MVTRVLLLGIFVKGYNTELHVWAAEGVATGDSTVSMWAKHFDALWSLGAEPSWRPGAAT